jgi:ferrous iron transport protein B
MIMSVTTWALAYFPSGDFNTSYLAMIGQYLTPFGDLMGCDWRWIVALITSTIQKENAFAVLAVLFGDDMIPTMQASLSPAGALAFMTAYMLSIPCMVTIAAIASESQSWKWAAFILVWVTFLSIVIAILTFQVASLFM